jgi:hypothetical protein
MKKLAITLLLVAVLTLGLTGTATAASAPSARGGGEFAFPGGISNTAFTAIQVDATTGAAKGQFYNMIVAGGSYVGCFVVGKVLYLAVNGTRAWIGFVVTDVYGPGMPVGSEWVFEVQDNGQGKKATGPDLMSDLTSMDASDALSQPDLLSMWSYSWTHGNIKVFPGK